MTTNNLRRPSRCPKSCGCEAFKATRIRMTRHGLKGLPEYGVWKSMNQRCNDPNWKDYRNWGGRGIKVCRRWNGPEGFTNFLSDMGRRPAGTTLERVDNDKDYGPGNCRWATRREQNRNRRSNNSITFNGETRCLAAWTELLGFSRSLIYARLANGWSVQAALSTPVKRAAGVFPPGSC